MITLVNGLSNQWIEPSDRGLQFGDGVFETVRLRHGQPMLWDRHWIRLCRGLDGLGIPRPLEADCLKELCRVANAPLVTAKLIVTRGPAPRGYAIPSKVSPTRIAMGGAVLAAEGQDRLLRIGVCATRTSLSPLPGCKHLNRLENVLARREWKPDWDEGLMLDEKGRIRCGTQSNVFVLEGNRLLTPSVSRYGVAGTRRGWLVDHAGSMGLDVREADLSLERLRKASAILLSSTVIGFRLAALVTDSPENSPAASPELVELAKAIGERMHGSG